MKARLLIAAILLSARHLPAQTYAYQPLALDTSCYWRSDYNYHDGSFDCRGERLSAVTGDTIIGAYRFTKISTYLTAYYYSGGQDEWACIGDMKTPLLSILREDTAARKVYSVDGSVMLDFNKNVGDTLNVFLGPYNPPVDSVTIRNINGTDRRMQWYTIRPFGYGRPDATIEGIGATCNFPVVGYSEWMIPRYRLKCYAKGGRILYTDGTATTCARMPAITLGVAAAPAPERSSFGMVGQDLRILKADLLPVRVQVLDITGRLLRTFTVHTTAPTSLDLPSGNYILRLYKDRKGAAFLINIE